MNIVAKYIAMKTNAIAQDLPSYLFTSSNHLVVYYPNGLEGPVYEWDKGQ